MILIRRMSWADPVSGGGKTFPARVPAPLQHLPTLSEWFTSVRRLGSTRMAL